ncbi:hypothetical protein [Virgisporangium ochraceum]|nr:hypothetical protein [Virgisporangium ochraceum]
MWRQPVAVGWALAIAVVVAVAVAIVLRRLRRVIPGWLYPGLLAVALGVAAAAAYRSDAWRTSYWAAQWWSNWVRESRYPLSAPVGALVSLGVPAVLALGLAVVRVRTSAGRYRSAGR